MAVRGLSGNEIARALISMMARSTKCSNRRPDTLMQDRTSANSTKSSCNARPDHTFGSFSTKTPEAADPLRVRYAPSPGALINLTVSQISVSVASSAAWATRERRGESGHQSPSHRCNRVRNVAFRPQRRILWAGNLRVRQIAGRAWWHDLLRGESFLVRKSGSRMPQCKGWRDGGSHAIPVLQNLPGRPPA